MKVKILPVECVACKRSMVKHGDTKPAHTDHWECSGCGQKYQIKSVISHHPKSVYAITVKFCPACGGEIEP